LFTCVTPATCWLYGLTVITGSMTAPDPGGCHSSASSQGEGPEGTGSQKWSQVRGGMVRLKGGAPRPGPKPLPLGPSSRL
jgi:hypothetical protein